jgi:hypothetical protein
MKHSKIFLITTTCLLAIAGITAAKKLGPSKTRWYTTAPGFPPGLCRPVVKTWIYDAAGVWICTTLYGTQRRIVYTVGALVSGLPQPANATNCIHPLIYRLNIE